MNRIVLLAGSITLAASVFAGTAQAECYEDNFNYTWNLTEVANTADFRRYSGTMTNLSGSFAASAVTDKNTGSTAVSSNFGTGFTYLVRRTGLGVSTGPWYNIVGSAGGTVSYFRECSSTSTLTTISPSNAASIDATAKPGEE